MALKTYPTIGCCGLDCGLCPRFYTNGPSRCPGCGGPDFFSKHPSCSFLTCCVKKKGLEACGQCPEFPCGKFQSEEEYQSRPISTPYPPDRTILPNLSWIKEHGIEKFIKQQSRRMQYLQTMIADFNDGRSRSFFCRAAALLDPNDLKTALDKAGRKVKTDSIGQNDLKQKAKILKRIIDEIAFQKGVQLAKKK